MLGYSNAGIPDKSWQPPVVVIETTCCRLVARRQMSSAKSMSSRSSSAVQGSPCRHLQVTLRITSSSTTINSKGDSKQPCLAPAVTTILSNGKNYVGNVLETCTFDMQKFYGIGTSRLLQQH
ncbi:peptidylprolyl isomerase isoform X1 [Bombyx mori]|uniref:peptidylprolyl isomerase isoform X1 n=1 Tax=Bombyx mori TaxID=7091 RepID=UPI002ED30363